MNTLFIHLQDGFTGDAVIIDVNGDEVFNEPDVQTKRLLGYAGMVNVPVDSAVADVSVRLPQKKSTANVQVPISGDTYLGISLQEGEITHFISGQPFGYG